MKIKAEDVLAAYVDGKLYCKKCLGKDDLVNANPEDLVLGSEVDMSDDMFYCDCEEHVGPRRIK